MWEETTYYIRDAQGNVMAVYKHTQPGGTPELRLEEMHIYGSSRLGMTSIRNNEMITAANPTDDGVFTRIIGETKYELSNHLGNVLSVITDIKIARATGANLDYYEAQVISYTDYYPFGSPMDNANSPTADRNWSGGYRYGFGGYEIESALNSPNESYTTEYRTLDARLARWLSLDPKKSKYPDLTPYSFAANFPLLFMDICGDTLAIFNESGSYVGWEDDGKTAWTGRYTTALQAPDGTYLTTNVFFTFNDANGLDVAALKCGIIDRIAIINQNYIDGQMEKGFPKDQVKIEELQKDRDKAVDYFKEQGKADGNLDLGIKICSSGGKDSFYIVDGTAYNVADFGNYLIGYAAGLVNIPCALMKAGGHYNHVFNGRSDVNACYDLECDQDGSYEIQFLDDEADQRAIGNGHDRATKDNSKPVQPKKIIKKDESKPNMG